MKKRIRDYIKKFFLINDTPHKVAAGAALGIFLGVVPGMGFLATLVLASLLRFNRLAALAAAGVMNIWTNFLFFAPAAYAGGLIFGVNYEDLKTCFHDTYRLGLVNFLSGSAFFGLTLPLISGFLIIAGILAFASYFGLFYFLCRRKKFCESEHLLQK